MEPRTLKNWTDKPGDILRRFDSVSEYREAVLEFSDRSKIRAAYDWYGNITWEQAVELTRTGDPSIVPRVNALVDQVEQAAVETPTREWVPSQAGAYAVVPEYLAGAPRCMRMVTYDETERGPIGIYVNVSSSCSYDYDALLTRGAAILALVEKIQLVRPVDLYIVATLDNGSKGANNVIVIKVDTRPIDIGLISPLIAHCGVDRHLNHVLGKSAGGTFGVGWAKCHGSREEFGKFVGLNETDLYILPSHLYDADANLMTDPVKWINAKLAKALGEKGGE